MAAWFLTAATSARLRGRLPHAPATLEALLLNTKMLLLFENVQTEDVKGGGEEHEGALRRTGSLVLRFGPAPGSWVILVLVPAGPLMPHFRVCMFLVQCSRGFRECSPGLDCTRTYAGSSCSSAGKNADLSTLVAPQPVGKTPLLLSTSGQKLQTSEPEWGAGPGK